MYILNKVIGFLCNPMNVAALGFVAAFAGLLLACRGKGAGRLRTFSVGLLVGSGIWLWLWSTPLVRVLIGASLERPYLVEGRIPSVEKLPKASAIVLHGGSMGDNAELDGRGEMWTSADRVWTAARLWRAQAPTVKLFVTGGGVTKTTSGLLADFGIPTNAVVFAEGPRNTEEESRFIGSVDFSASSLDSHSRPKVLVVTSAWHMRRTLMMYAKYAPQVEAIPVPCDFENMLGVSKDFSLDMLLPSDEALVANRVSLHEWIGIIGYRWLRK